MSAGEPFAVPTTCSLFRAQEVVANDPGARQRRGAASEATSTESRDLLLNQPGQRPAVRIKGNPANPAPTRQIPAGTSMGALFNKGLTVNYETTFPFK